METKGQIYGRKGGDDFFELPRPEVEMLFCRKKSEESEKNLTSDS